MGARRENGPPNVPDPIYKWNPRAGRYIAPSGRFVTQGAVQAAIEGAIKRSTQRITDASEALQAGRITLGQWQREMRRGVKDVTLYSAASVKGGWAQLDQRDLGRVGRIVKSQYGYLDRFAAQLASGKVRADGRFTERAKLYTRSGRQTVHLFGRVAARGRGETLERSVLESGHPCGLCVSEAGRGFVEIGELLPIGSRTCGMNDKCRIEYA